jgi:hypothetical protein
LRISMQLEDKIGRLALRRGELLPETVVQEILGNSHLVKKWKDPESVRIQQCTVSVALQSHAFGTQNSCLNLHLFFFCFDSRCFVIPFFISLQFRSFLTLFNYLKSCRQKNTTHNPLSIVLIMFLAIRLSKREHPPPPPNSRAPLAACWTASTKEWQSSKNRSMAGWTPFEK